METRADRRPRTPRFFAAAALVLLAVFSEFSKFSLLAMFSLLAVLTVFAGCSGPSAAVRTAPPALDYEAFQAAATEISRFDPGGRISRVEWSSDGRTLSYRRLDQPCVLDLETLALTEVQAAAESDAGQDGDGDGRRVRGRRSRGPGRGRQRSQETSPDGRWVAICRDYNVVVEPVEPVEEDDDDDEADAEASEGDGPNTEDAGGGTVIEGAAETRRMIAVTTEGTRKHRFGMASWVYGEELDQSTAMWWSPDSRKLVYYEFDERDVPDFYLLKGLTDLRASPLLEGYPKPGETNPVASLHVHDIETGVAFRIASDAGLEPPSEGESEEWYVYNVRFTPGGGELLVNRTNRHQNVLHVDAFDLETGGMRRVVTETQETWQKNRPSMRFLDDGERFIWETEKSGNRQFELRHLDGRLLATLTPPGSPAVAIRRVDEQGGVVFYSAYEPERPLDEHLFRVGLDGSGRRRITLEPGSHSITFSPDGKWILSTFESVARPPATVLYSAEGRRLVTLAESDPERLAELGHPEPELFTFKADDGETDLYGWLYKPRDFDPRRSYPLLIDVYGGPGSKGVRNRYRVTNAGCNLGFIVAKIDNRGTGGRGKAFLGSVYQKLGIVDIKDQADGVRHLARRPYIDADRVGIYGHSYGGYMAALAILKFPDVYRCAVAGAPVTDWKNYDTIYTERYMRTPEENPDGYVDGSCLTYAEQLRGELLILHGMVDDNVHPNNAWQLVDALQEAEKSFEVMFYPNSGHGLRSHSSRVRWEFLYRHLIEDPGSRGEAEPAGPGPGKG